MLTGIIQKENSKSDQGLEPEVRVILNNMVEKDLFNTLELGPDVVKEKTCETMGH